MAKPKLRISKLESQSQSLISAYDTGPSGLVNTAFNALIAIALVAAAISAGSHIIPAIVEGFTGGDYGGDGIDIGGGSLCPTSCGGPEVRAVTVHYSCECPPGSTLYDTLPGGNKQCICG